MVVDDSLADRQPDPVAALRVAGGALKELKNAVLVGWINAGPVVAHAKHPPVVVRAGPPE